MNYKENIFMFDVESTSLHGVGFAVGAVVANRLTGHIVDRFELLSIEGASFANSWVRSNVMPVLASMRRCNSLSDLRNEFFRFYSRWMDSCDFWSDCNFPVETNFLAAVVLEDISQREFAMPYPIYDVCSYVHVSIDRIAYCGRQGLRKHHPLDDAIASLEALLMPHGRFRSNSNM